MKEQPNIPLASSDLGWHISASRSYEITTPKNKSSYRNVLMPMNLVKMLWDIKSVVKKNMAIVRIGLFSEERNRCPTKQSGDG